MEAKIETVEIVIMGRLYKIIASPSILQDYHPCIQVFIAERENSRAHWRTIPHGPKHAVITDQAQRKPNGA